MYKRKSYISLLLTTTLLLSACSQQNMFSSKHDHIISKINYKGTAYEFILVGMLIIISILELSLFLLKKGEIKRLKEANKNLNELVKSSTDALDKLRKDYEKQEKELKRMSELHEELSLRDPLTGFWNKNHYDKIIKVEWNRSLRHKRTISLLLVDIDNFRLYNDYYGYSEGDDCLIRIANAINTLFKRASDIAVRYDGEKFVVVLAEQSKEEALSMAERLRQIVVGLNIPHKTSPISPWVTVSIGVNSMVPNMKYSLNELILGADRAVYKAKELGKNRVEFDPYG